MLSTSAFGLASLFPATRLNPLHDLVLILESWIHSTATTPYIVLSILTANNVEYGVPDSRRTIQEAPASYHKFVSGLLFCHRNPNPARSDIKLQPSTSNYDISMKVLVDGQEAHRLPAIRRGTSLSWERTLACDVDSSSRVELRVYEKHLWGLKRVGSLEYLVSTVASQLEATLEFDTRKFTAALSFPTPEEVG
ncbi:hypothetical protein BDV93DRAFT_516044 [Ceratobasidium sp. AG-I]|nr:hypothetical protein BDV93DRAFT_516044 [Ceratobasidium sp. AG-I]